MGIYFFRPCCVSSCIGLNTNSTPPRSFGAVIFILDAHYSSLAVQDVGNPPLLAPFHDDCKLFLAQGQVAQDAQ